MIRITCTACGGACRAPAEAQGKILKCPHCRGPIAIPGAEPEAIVVEPVPVKPPMLTQWSIDLQRAGNQAVADWKKAHWGVKAFVCVVLGLMLILSMVAGARDAAASRSNADQDVLNAVVDKLSVDLGRQDVIVDIDGWHKDLWRAESLRSRDGGALYSVSGYVDGDTPRGPRRINWSCVVEDPPVGRPQVSNMTIDRL